MDRVQAVAIVRGLIDDGHAESVLQALLGEKTDVEGFTLCDNVYNIANSEGLTIPVAMQTIVYRYLSGSEMGEPAWPDVPSVDFSGAIDAFGAADIDPRSAAVAK